MIAIYKDMSNLESTVECENYLLVVHKLCLQIFDKFWGIHGKPEYELKFALNLNCPLWKFLLSKFRRKMRPGARTR